MDDSARISALELRVAELERKLNAFMDHSNFTYTPAPLDPALEAAAKWVRQGNKIEAVKVYQKMTGKGLKESKDAVDGLAQMLGAS